MRIEVGQQRYDINQDNSYEFSSQLMDRAEKLAQQGRYLEVTSRSDGEILPHLPGYRLEDGMIVYRGNVKKVDAPRGGTYYIDGNVEVLKGDGGIVYINGNLKKLTDTDSTILIVTGEVGEYDQNHQSVGGLRQPITHSPFLFSPHTPLRELQEHTATMNTAVQEDKLLLNRG